MIEEVGIETTHSPGISYLSYQLKVILLRNEAVSDGFWKTHKKSENKSIENRNSMGL